MLDDLKKIATKLKSLQNAGLMDKISQVSQLYQEALSIISAYQGVNSASAQSAINYLDELEKQILQNKFKHTYEALLQITA